MKQIKQLSGHSGCGLLLYEGGDGFFVRKISQKASYDFRLRKQFIKQQRFSSENFATPAILSYGRENGHFYFDMQFIRGVTLAEYMKIIKTKEIVNLINYLFKSMPIESNSCRPDAQSVFQNKIADLCCKMNMKSPVQIEAFSRLKGFDFSAVPSSYCCGDLTLENILLSETDRRIYLIDFLDSFFNSWMIDVAKLLQDLELGWSWRKQSADTNRNLRCMIARQALIEGILDLPDGQSKLESVYHILLLNILRIYPYTHDAETYDFLESALRKTLNIISDLKEKAA